MKEVWRDIADYEGLYQVSNLGRVKSLERCVQRKNKTTLKVKEKIIKVGITKDGYFRVKLSKQGISNNFSVHRLVAEAFIPNPDKLPQVNHKNEFEKWNNKVDNLEWCTQQYNIRFSRSVGVNQFDLKGNLIKEWNCIKEASKYTNIPSSNIVRCCQNKLNMAGGFKWEYKKEA